MDRAGHAFENGVTRSDFMSLQHLFDFQRQTGLQPFGAVGHQFEVRIFAKALGHDVLEIIPAERDPACFFFPGETADRVKPEPGAGLQRFLDGTGCQLAKPFVDCPVRGSEFVRPG